MSEDMRNSQDLDARLDRLFSEYRAQLPDPEPNVNFMPNLWERIEKSRSFTLDLRRWARGFMTAAAAICALMALYLIVPDNNSTVYNATYLEALTADHPSEQPVAYVEVLHHEMGSNLQ